MYLKLIRSPQCHSILSSLHRKNFQTNPPTLSVIHYAKQCAQLGHTYNYDARVIYSKEKYTHATRRVVHNSYVHSMKARTSDASYNHAIVSFTRSWVQRTRVSTNVLCNNVVIAVLIHRVQL